MRFTSIDFEKANNDSTSVCSIGVSVFENDQLLYSNNYLVQPPGNEYLELHTSIHGITAIDTATQPHFPIVWKEISEDIIGRTVVAHNGSTVEFPILESLFDFYEMEKPVFTKVCTLNLSQKLFPYLKSHKLSSLAELFSFNFNELLHHHSQYDSEICGFIFIKMKNSFVLDENFQPTIKKEKTTVRKDIFRENFDNKKIDSLLVTPSATPKYENHYFYSKKVVITGEFDAFPKQRNKLAQILFDCGADINTAISKKTDLVLIGTGAGPKKLEQITTLNIMTMQEAELIELIKDFING